MRSQTLAVSIVLLLITVAALPGLSFSLSSSVTSQNNNISYDTGGIEISNSGYKAIKIEDGTFVDNEAYEIASSSGSFGNGKGIELKIPGNKTFVINVKIDEYYAISGFDLTISYPEIEDPITARNIYGGNVNSGLGTSAQGYLCEPSRFPNNNWHLEKEIGGARTFNSESGNVTVTIDGFDRGSNIHFYIVFLNQEVKI